MKSHNVMHDSRWSDKCNTASIGLVNIRRNRTDEDCRQYAGLSGDSLHAGRRTDDGTYPLDTPRSAVVSSDQHP